MEGLMLSIARLSRDVLAAGLALLAVACTSVPRAAPGYAVHDFGPVMEPAPRTLAFAVRNIEVVPAPWLASTAMQYRLLYAQPTRRLAFVESRWAAQPAQLVELTIRRALRSDASAAGGSGCKLQIDLDEFVQVFTTESQSAGRIEARAALLAPRSEQVVASRAFSVLRPAPSPVAAGGVVALGQGVAQLNHDLLDWLDSLDRDPARRLRARCGA